MKTFPHTAHNRYCCTVMVLSFLLIILSAGITSAQQIRSGEYNIKAAFVYNFTRFIEWPDSAFAEPRSPFVIGVIGADPFGSRLEAIMNGETVKGRPIQIRRFNNLSQSGNCHIVFVSGKTQADVKKLCEQLRGKPILTVSDRKNFDEEGGIIMFATEDNRIKVIINSTAAKASTLNISSKLLKIAELKEEQP